jgi:hypothetical protein
MKRFRPTSPIFTLAPVVLSTLFACGKPERPPVPTLESPAALAIAQWCNQLTGTGAVQYLPASACASPVDITSRGAVANTGRADIQLVSLDTSRPAYVDLDPGEPGNTGIDVPDGPSTVAVGLVPTVALVGSSREPALSAVDVVQGVPVGQPLRLSSVQTWWCGNPAELQHVLANLDKLVIKPLSRASGARVLLGPMLSQVQLDRLRARIAAHPRNYVGQELARFSATPTLSETGVEPRAAVAPLVDCPDPDPRRTMR